LQPLAESRRPEREQMAGRAGSARRCPQQMSVRCAKAGRGSRSPRPAAAAFLFGGAGSAGRSHKPQAGSALRAETHENSQKSVGCAKRTHRYNDKYMAV
jgi:hypothetical protein